MSIRLRMRQALFVAAFLGGLLFLGAAPALADVTGVSQDQRAVNANDTDQESDAVAISGVQANVAQPTAYSVFGDAEANAEQSNNNSAVASNENRTAQSIDQNQGVSRDQKVHRHRDCGGHDRPRQCPHPHRR